jgi:hypothetical protein
MKQFIEKFCDSETVTKEVGSVQNFKEWLVTFNFEVISQPALDELVQMVSVAEERFKIALMDLMRLLF